MREIVFRGKKLNGGEWIEGSLIKFSEDKYEIHVPFDPNKEITIVNTLEKVEPESIGQYTGLKDKNGVRIFEGDIVVNKQEHRLATADPEYAALIEDDAEDIYSEIAFSDGAFMLLEPGYAPEIHLAGVSGDIEIAGNVFDNAELLEVE